MGILQKLGLSNERRVPVDESPAAQALDELESVVAQLQDLGRAIDELREKRRALKAREVQLINERNARNRGGVTVAGQTLDGEF